MRSNLILTYHPNDLCWKVTKCTKSTEGEGGGPQQEPAEVGVNELRVVRRHGEGSSSDQSERQEQFELREGLRGFLETNIIRIACYVPREFDYSKIVLS